MTIIYPPSLLDNLTAIVTDAFVQLGLSPTYGRVVRSNRPDSTQFQCNGALAAAKSASRNPRGLAEEVAAILRDRSELQNVSVAGGGFLNLSVTDTYLAAWMNELADSPIFGKLQDRDETVVIDFGGPNVAKPMHVGHLRSAIIGDCLQRIFAHAGYEVISDIHWGDWGLPMGMLISEVGMQFPDLPYFDESWTKPYPDHPVVSLDQLEQMYPKASAACQDSLERLERARAATAELQRGRRGYRALWQSFIDVSFEAVRNDFADLGISFAVWNGESTVDHLVGPMIQGLRERGIACESDGAIVISVQEPTDRHDIPPLILQKKDGSAIYATTDLATIEDRVRAYSPTSILYVVDQRQSIHFLQLFRAAKRAEMIDPAKLEHIGFGTVNGTDGKPFKTREGGVMRLRDLIEMAESRASKRLDEAGLGHELDPKERGRVARMVGIGAVKFADLSNHRLSNYVFDVDRFTQLDGKTGPYIQYAAVRIKSLLNRAQRAELPVATIEPPSDIERELVLTLVDLPNVLRNTLADRAPHYLCDFCYYAKFHGSQLARTQRLLKLQVRRSFSPDQILLKFGLGQYQSLLHLKLWADPVES